MFIPQGLRLVHSGSVTKANMKLATVNAGAMIDIGVDWSAYAGNDAGNTPHMLILYDSTGKRMQGFIGASGGGEALGAELIINGSFTNWTGDAPDNWIVSSADANNYVTESPAGVANLISNFTTAVHFAQQTSVLVGSLYKITLNITINTLGWRRSFKVLGETIYTNSTDAGLLTYYGTNAGNDHIYFFRYSGGACNFEVDNVSCKKITDISTNGVHLHSTRGGINRNLASKDTEFDLNDSSGYTFKLYKCP